MTRPLPRPTVPRTARFVAIALCATGLIALAMVVRSGPLPIDDTIRVAVHAGQSVPVLLQGFNLAGQPLIWDAAVAILVAVLVIAHRRVEAAWIGLGLFVGELLATIIKVVVDRPRPPGVVVPDLITQASYPSGHVTRAALTGALIVLVWWGPSRLRPIAGAIAVVVAVLMGLARIVAGEHWPTDVLGAYLLTGMLAGIVAAAPQRFRRSAPVHPVMPAVDPGATARRP